MFAKVFVSAAFVATTLAQTFSLNTPASLIQCQPASVSWTGGTGPFVLSAIPAGQVSAPAIEFIATGLTASPYTWNVNLPAGTNITLRLADGSGNPVYASPLVIQNGPSSSCLNASASTSGLSTVSVSGTAAAVSGGSASSAAASTTSAMMSSSAAASSTMMSSTGMASSASGAATSAASGASSAAASATSKAAAAATALVGIPAMALGAIGAVVALL